MFKFILSLVLLISAHAQAAQTVLRGNHNGEDYEIALNDEWEDVIGSWGDSKKYNLAWDSYELTLKGNTAGLNQKFYYDSFIKEVELDSDCGWTQLKFDFTKNQSSGWYCNQQWSKTFASKTELIDTTSEMVLVELVKFFPDPTKEAVHQFFKPKLVHGLGSENAN